MDPPIQLNLPNQPHPPVQQIQPIPPDPAVQFPNLNQIALVMIPYTPAAQHFVAWTEQLLALARQAQEARLRAQKQNVLNHLANPIGYPLLAPQRPVTPDSPEIVGRYDLPLRYIGPRHRGGGGGPPIRVHQDNGFRNATHRVTDNQGRPPNRRSARIRQITNRRVANRELSAAEEFAVRSEAFETEEQRLDNYYENNQIVLGGKTSEEAFRCADYHHAAFKFYESFAKKEGLTRPDHLGPSPF